jgi:hypothetical protein
MKENDVKKGEVKVVAWKGETASCPKQAGNQLVLKNRGLSVYCRHVAIAPFRITTDAMTDGVTIQNFGGR